MKITFLEADRPLVKAYALVDGKLEKQSYPNAYEFTSHTSEITTLDEFAAALTDAASKGWCLLKGKLNRPLVSESRAGSTNPHDTTELICLDFDQLGRIPDIQTALDTLDAGNVSYVVQYSASHGIEPEKGCTAHVFMMLDKPASPDALKQWLMHLNLKVQQFRDALRLTATGNALSWGLDVSTCQNDKLIYIAPPIIGEGVVCQRTGPRIELIRRDLDKLPLDSLEIPPAGTNRAAMNTILDVLRSKKGLEPRKWATKTHSSGIEVLASPDAATYEMKQERGFTYFNLNGGDSWGYYHSDDNPDIIRNFKGEANYLTKDLLPDYWAELTKARNEAKQAMHRGPDAHSTKPQPLVLCDFKTALYFRGTWDPQTEELTLARAANETQLQHYLLEHGLPELDYIPTWNLMYDPKSDVRLSTESKIINTYRPSPYSKQEPIANPQFPIIQRVMIHAIGDNEELVDHFVNWAACIFKLRLHTMCSWVWQGIEGTGKGLLLNKVLIPLLGESNVVVKRMSETEDKFNSYMEGTQLVVIDEAQISESRQSQMLMAGFKNMITEPQLSIRRMHTAAYIVPNFCNFLFLSNWPDPINISATDRRFNVGNYRTTKLILTPAEIDQITDELPAFASYLLAYDADASRARQVMETEEREQMMRTTSNSVERTCEALRDGDLEFFWDALPAGEGGYLPPERQMLHDQYLRFLSEALGTEHGVHRMARDDIALLLEYNVGDMPKTPAKITQLLLHKRIAIKKMRINGRPPTQGFEVTWKQSNEWKIERLQELQLLRPGNKSPQLKIASVSNTGTN